MTVLRESPWYQEIIEQAMQQGFQQGFQQVFQQAFEQGFQQGFQQGLREGLLSGIALGLELKFGATGLELLPEIREISDVDRLKAIQDGIKTENSVEELRRIYKS